MFKDLSTNNKIYLASLGCSRNLVDSEVMLGLLLKNGYEVAQTLEDADFLIVNTCGFLEAARRESSETIEAFLSEKKDSAKVIVTGCMVQKMGEEMRELFPEVHYFLGSGDAESILKAITSETQGEEISSAKSYLQHGEIPRQLSTPQHYGYLKIAEGCAKRCAFCIIPKIKGPLRSKPVEQVIKEFKALLSQGVKEVILIAQDLGDYGKERGEIEGLENLVKHLLEVEGDYWIRFLYLYPDEITDSLIELMKSDSRICPYLDMPIQHINDKILKSMRRKTNQAHITSTLSKLRQALPNIVIRTSLMVGFPGETDEDFNELLNFVKTQKLDNVGIFQYSNEKEASSYRFEEQVSEKVKQKRFEILAAAQQKVVEKKAKKFLGKRLKVLLEGYHEESPYLMKARHSGQCPDVDGHIIVNDSRKAKAFGIFHEVEITDVLGYDLIAKITKPLDFPKKKRPALSLIS